MGSSFGDSQGQQGLSYIGVVPYIFSQVSGPLELPDSQKAVQFATRIRALGADLSMSALGSAGVYGQKGHTERRKVRVMFQNMGRRSVELAYALSRVVAI